MPNQHNILKVKRRQQFALIRGQAADSLPVFRGVRATVQPVIVADSSHPAATRASRRSNSAVR